MSDKISIIVPVYNQAHNIKIALDCLQNQSCKDLEIIVVDDASTDNSIDVISEYTDNDKRFKKISLLKNRGVYQARLAGIKSATGKFTGFLDSDDSCSKDMFAEMYRQAIANNADMVECNFKVIFDNYEQREYARPKSYYNASPPEAIMHGREIFRALLNPRAWHAVWNKLFKTDILQSAVEFLPQDIRIDRCEDLLLCCAFSQLARKAIYFPGKLYCYCCRDFSLTQVLTAKEIKAYINDDITVLKYCEKWLRENEHSLFEGKKTAHIRAVFGYLREYAKVSGQEFRNLLDCVAENYGGTSLLALENDHRGISGRKGFLYHIIGILKLAKGNMLSCGKNSERILQKPNNFELNCLKNEKIT